MKPTLDFEIIVVDNNSQDGSIEMLAKNFPAVKIIANKENLGYAKGVNIGVMASRGTFVAIFNPDIFINKGSLESCVNYLENNLETDIVGPRLTNPDGSLQNSCYRYPKIYTPFVRRTFFGATYFGKKELDRYLMRDFSHNESVDVNWLLGGALLCRKSALLVVGLFDERYFLYFEDTDICRKINSLGKKVVYLPSASMVHMHRRESADFGIIKSLSKKATREHIKSAIKYFIKWGID